MLILSPTMLSESLSYEYTCLYYRPRCCHYHMSICASIIARMLSLSYEYTCLYIRYDAVTNRGVYVPLLSPTMLFFLLSAVFYDLPHPWHEGGDPSVHTGISRNPTSNVPGGHAHLIPLVRARLTLAQEGPTRVTLDTGVVG